MSKWTRWMVVAAMAAFVTPAGAAVFTVGPDGAYGTIQAGLEAAITAGGNNEVRVEQGTYTENIFTTDRLTSGSLVLSGGWDAAFAGQTGGAGATVIDGTSGGYCLDMRPQGGSLDIEGLTFTHSATGSGGGLHLELHGDSMVKVHGCRATGNAVATTGDSDAEGGGIYAYAGDTSHVEITDCTLSSNSLTADTGPASGAGLSLYASGTGYALASGNVITDNAAVAPQNQVTGAGLFVYALDQATVYVNDNIVARNMGTVVDYGMLGSGAAVWATGQATLTARRNTFLGNGSPNDKYNNQCEVTASSTSTIVFTDALAAAGAGSTTGGLSAEQFDTGTVHVANVTVADNTGFGLIAWANGGVCTVTNAIAHGNETETDQGGGAQVTNILIFDDPMFVDPARWDYRLMKGSPAIDAGDDSPPGGLGATDLAGTPREVGSHVDEGAYEYHQAVSAIPVVAHLYGAGGTPFRSALTAANLAGALTGFDLALTEGGGQTEISSSLQGAQTDTFGDVVVSPLGFPASEQHSGALWLTANSPGMAFSSRTYADPGGGAGTYGQFLPAVGDADMLTSGEMAIIPLVRSDAGYYTNVGMVNGGDASCTAEVRLFGASGTQVGTTQTLTAAPRAWAQINNVFTKAGVSNVSVAYAVVDVSTSGGKAWFYGSVLDRTTKDPTTVPMQAAAPGGSVLYLPAAAHISGAGGTPWRTRLGIVNAGTGMATVTLVYRSGSTSVTRTTTIPAGGAKGWDDLLVGLFGYADTSASSGSVEITSDQPVAVAGRSYADMGASGTYGQFLPALNAGSDGTGSLVAGVLPQLREDASFYTNVGFQNLTEAACDVRVTLYGSDGSQLGTPLTRTLAAGAWSQIYKVFDAAGAGNAPVAYAVVEVLTPGGRVWGYGSVIDSISHDPTTVPLQRPWVIGPPIT